MATTPKLALPLPAGSDVVSRAAYGDALPNAIDANAASQAQADQPFHLDSVTYDAANNRLVCTLNSGRAVFPGGLLVSQTGPQLFYVNAPAVSTAYYLYLQTSGVYLVNTTGALVPGAVLLWKIATAASLATAATLTDQRGQLPGASAAGTTVTTAAATYALALTDQTVVANVTGGAVAVTLPAATGSGRQVWFRKNGTANPLTLSANPGDTFDETGSASLVLPAALPSDGRLVVDSAAGLWRVLARGGDVAAPVTTTETVLAAPAASVTLNLPPTFRTVRIEYYCQSTNPQRRQALQCWFNGDTTLGHYVSEGMWSDDGVFTSRTQFASQTYDNQIGFCTGTPTTTAFTTGPGTGELVIVGANLAQTQSAATGTAFFFGRSFSSGQAATNTTCLAQFGLAYGPPATFTPTSITLFPELGSFAAGSVFRVIATP